METVLTSYLKNFSKKPKGMAEHAFNAGLQRIGGAKFMAQHTGWEQTTGNGINTLQHFGKIADVVESVYPRGIRCTTRSRQNLLVSGR